MFLGSLEEKILVKESFCIFFISAMTNFLLTIYFKNYLDEICLVIMKNLIMKIIINLKYLIISNIIRDTILLLIIELILNICIKSNSLIIIILAHSFEIIIYYML
jgi:hypothetical protein